MILNGIVFICFLHYLMLQVNSSTYAVKRQRNSYKENDNENRFYDDKLYQHLSPYTISPLVLSIVGNEGPMKLHNDLKDYYEDVKKRFRESLDLLRQQIGVLSYYKLVKDWYTWRKVEYAEGNSRNIFYICVMPPQLLNDSNAECIGGYWKLLQSAPVCSVHITSMVAEDTVCGTKPGAEALKLRQVCSMADLHSVSDLIKHCGCFIRREYTFCIDYGIAIERPYIALICDGEDPCRVTLTYELNEKFVIFRLINKYKKVIYRNVMLPAENNFECIESCGFVDNNGLPLAEYEKKLPKIIPVSNKTYSIGKNSHKKLTTPNFYISTTIRKNINSSVLITLF